MASVDLELTTLNAEQERTFENTITLKSKQEERSAPERRQEKGDHRNAERWRNHNGRISKANGFSHAPCCHVNILYIVLLITFCITLKAFLM